LAQKPAWVPNTGRTASPKPAITACEPSVEPSSATTISRGGRVWAMTDRIASPT
jgi:hypothetical protein